MTSKKLHLLLPLALPVTWSLAGSLHAATVTSIATGEWDVATTWSNAAAAPITGTQGSGDDFVLAPTFTVSSNDNTLNAQALIGHSITVQSGAVLDLARLHLNTAQAVVWNLPAITLADGGELQFRASTGTSNHSLAANIATTGNTTIDNTGGAYGQDISYTGILSGSGTVTYKTANSGSMATARTLSLKTAASPFTGDWSIQHAAGTSDDYGALRADAANALGTGNVILGNRAQLINGVAGGLNSLAGIDVESSSAIADLGAGWTNPAGVLTLADGVVNLGSASSFGTASFATFNHGFGLLQFDLGSSPANADKVTISGDYVANEGSPIDIRLTADPGTQTYNLLSYGTLTGTPDAQVITPTRLVPNISLGDGSNDKITVSFTGSTANLLWKGDDGTSPNSWTVDGAPNFDNAGVPDKFFSIDSVAFDDSAASFTPTLTGSLVPRSVTINSSANAYTFSGTGSIAGATSVTKSGTADLTLTTTNSFTGGTVLNAGRLRLGNASALGSGPLTINGGSVSASDTTARTFPVAVVIHAPFTLGDATDSGGLTFSGGGTLTANTVITVPTAATVGHAINGVLTDGAGSFSITKEGATGSLTLSGANTYDGGTTVSAGRISAGNPGALGTGPVSVAAGGSVYYSAAGTIANNFTIAGNGWTEAAGSPGALRLGAGNTVSGSVTLAADSRITAYNSTGTISGVIGQSGGARKLEFGGSGLGGGGGTITVSGANTYTGGTEVRGAIVVAKNNSAFGPGDVLIDEGAAVGYVTRVELQGITVANNFVLDSTAQTGFLGPVTASGGTLSTVNGSVTVSAGVGNGGHLASTGTGSILQLNGPLNVLNGAVPNVRAGTVILAGGGTYPRLDQGEGTLRLGANNGISTAAQLRLAISNPGTFDLNGFNQTLTQINRAATAAATITNTGATPSVLTISGSDDHSYPGTITDSTSTLSLVKGGSSVLTLGGVSSYLGSTTVNGGTLRINAAHGILGMSPITVAAAGTLGGSGPLNGAVTVAGTIAPGTAAGTLVSNDAVTFGPGSRYAWEVADWTGTTAGTSFDLLDVRTLALTATAGSKLTIAVSGAAANFTESAKTFEIARSTDPITGFNAAAIQVDKSGFTGAGTFAVQVNGNSIQLVYTPGSGTPFSNWASANGIPGASADIDSDGDGILNGIEFVIGGDPSGPGSNSASLVPAVTTDATYINFTFRRTDASAGSNPYVEYNSSLSSTWTKAESGVNGVIVQETNDGFGAGVDSVTVKIPRTLASGAKLFARLRVIIP